VALLLNNSFFESNGQIYLPGTFRTVGIPSVSKTRLRQMQFAVEVQRFVLEVSGFAAYHFRANTLINFC
jgi:hypothetical protein